MWWWVLLFVVIALIGLGVFAWLGLRLWRKAKALLDALGELAHSAEEAIAMIDQVGASAEALNAPARALDQTVATPA